MVGDSVVDVAVGALTWTGVTYHSGYAAIVALVSKGVGRSRASTHASSIMSDDRIQESIDRVRSVEDLTG